MIYHASKNVKKRLILFVFLLVIIGQSAVDIYLPSFPAIFSYFNTTHSLVELTLSVFVIAYACSQLVYGPLSDHFGRRPVLLFGLCLFLFATIMCAKSASIEELIIFRCLQGAGAGTANVHQRVLIRDVFQGKELYQYAAFGATIWALVPMLAPLIGGYIQNLFCWQANFIALVVMQIVILIALVLWLPETCPQIRGSTLTVKKIAINYKMLFLDSIFMGNVICCAILNSFFLTFNVAGPFLYQESLGLTPVTYGWTLIISSGGFLLGSFLNSRLIQIFLVYRIVLFGFVIILLFSFILLLLAIMNMCTAMSVIIEIGFVFFGIGLIYSNCVAGSIKHYPQAAGSAGAALGFLVSLIGGIISAIYSITTLVSAISIALTFICLAIISFVVYLCFVLNKEKDILTFSSQTASTL